MKEHFVFPVFCVLDNNISDFTNSLMSISGYLSLFPPWNWVPKRRRVSKKIKVFLWWVGRRLRPHSDRRLRPLCLSGLSFKQCMYVVGRVLWIPETPAMPCPETPALPSHSQATACRWPPRSNPGVAPETPASPETPVPWGAETPAPLWLSQVVQVVDALPGAAPEYPRRLRPGRRLRPPPGRRLRG